MKLRIIAEIRNLFCRHVPCEHDLACVVGAEGCVGVLHENELDSVGCNSVRIPVILILLSKNVGTWNPLLDLHRSVAHISGRIYCPRLAVCLYSGLLNGT